MNIGEHVWWVWFSDISGMVSTSIEQVVIIEALAPESIYRIKAQKRSEYVVNRGNLFRDKKLALNESIRKLQECLFNE